jgi:hypothetical protein
MCSGVEGFAGLEGKFNVSKRLALIQLSIRESTFI